MNRFVLIALATAGLAAAAALHANDSTAEMAAGGLVLRQSRDIEMKSEDLFVSAEEVRVRYVFRNRSARPIRTIVAFPMPDLDMEVASEMDVAAVTDFRTTVGGRPVRMRAERRAFARGVDQTALLTRLGIPLEFDSTGSETIGAAIRRQPREERERLASLGLLNGTTPAWTYRETWFWEQVFPPGRDLVIAHRYVPGTGGTVSTPLTSPEYRNEEGMRDYRSRYCVDRDFLAGVDRLAADIRRGRYVNVTEQWVSYVLTTGGNWRGPIGDFRLVVDKGAPENLISFCGQGVRRISPTRFEVRRRNWRPDRDLNLLILRPYGPNG